MLRIFQDSSLVVLTTTEFVCVCLCDPILITMCPEWLSGMEPWPCTPGAVHPSLSCLQCVCMPMYSFTSLIRWMPSPRFSDTAITNHHSDTTIFQLRAHWVQISWSNGSEKSLGHTCAAGGRRTLDSLHEWRTPYPLGHSANH